MNHEYMVTTFYFQIVFCIFYLLGIRYVLLQRPLGILFGLAGLLAGTASGRAISWVYINVNEELAFPMNDFWTWIHLAVSVVTLFLVTSMLATAVGQLASYGGNSTEE